MTEKELSGLYWLNRETERLQNELDELEEAIGPKAAALSHSPKAKGKRPFCVGDLAAEIADLKALIGLNLQKVRIERARLERYIGGIECAETRLIFRLRHVGGMTWRQIGMETHMDHTTAIRKHRAFLKLAPNAPR